MNDLTAIHPDLSNSNFALFGLGDSSYPDFCGALPLVKKSLQNFGAKVFDKDFTIDGYAADNEIDKLSKWAENYLSGN